MIQPLERECICRREVTTGRVPLGERMPNGHTQACNDKQRADFFGAKQQIRNEFYGTPERTN